MVIGNKCGFKTPACLSELSAVDEDVKQMSSNTIDLQPAIERVAGVQANIAKVRDLASKVNKTNRCVQDQNDGYHAR